MQYKTDKNQVDTVLSEKYDYILYKEYTSIHSWLKYHFGLANRCESGFCEKKSNNFQFKYNGQDENKRQQELNFAHRVLFHRLKEKFVGIDNNLTELMKEFMADLVIMDKNGNSSTLGQVVLPQYQKNLESGEQGEFKLLGDGN